MIKWDFVTDTPKYDKRGMMMTETKATVTAIGKQALGHADPMVVLFGEEATDEIASIAVIQRFSDKAAQAQLTMARGDQVQINDDRYAVTYVGRAASANLQTLGHVALVFTDKLAGDRLQNALYLAPLDGALQMPEFTVGTPLVYIHQG
ncbi:MAG: PTS glucitol/sorbitol transporter subunit IIA [Schleiferilactobacillus perolens]